jgi:riboflavin synthase
MFTGIIEAICKVKSVRPAAGGMLLTIDLADLAEESSVGDSIAINGACLTIARLDGNLAAFDVSPETLARTSLGKLNPLSEVNVELAMKATDRFGGHFVQGHIDGTATIKAIEIRSMAYARKGDFADMKFAAAPELLDSMVVKGSVAVDGISLTVAGMDKDSFTVAIIPQTLKKTTLGRVKNGDLVNIETDIIVKTIKKQLESILGEASQRHSLTAEKLRQLGF